MKITQINIDGCIRHTTIKSVDKNGFCTLTEKAKHYILSQTCDGKVYQGTEETELFCNINGNISRYWYNKDSQSIDILKSFVPQINTDLESTTGKIELRTLDVMED